MFVKERNKTITLQKKPVNTDLGSVWKMKQMAWHVCDLNIGLPEGVKTCLFFLPSANISLKVKKKYSFCHLSTWEFLKHYLGSVPVSGVLTCVVVTSLDSSLDCKEKVRKKEMNQLFLKQCFRWLFKLRFILSSIKKMTKSCIIV